MCSLSHTKVLMTFRRLSCLRSQFLVSRGVTQDASSTSFKRPKLPGNIDPFPVFMEEEVQTILTRITGVDLKKAAEIQPTLKPNKPVFKVVPEKELRRLQAEAVKKQRAQIEQRPPFMNTRKEIDVELARNPEIAPVMTNNLLFIDTSAYTRPERANKDKVVIVRDTEGTLRMARHEERERAIQIAFPVPGRTIFPSHFFSLEYLQNALENCRYSYVLDKVCVQYEPDDPEFIRISCHIFDHILERKEFDSLRGTRHFGSLVFYLALCRRDRPLVLDMLQRHLVLDVCDVIRLVQRIYTPREQQSKPPPYTTTSVQKTLDKYISKVTNPEEKRNFTEAMDNIKSRGLSEVIGVNKSERDLIEDYLKQ